MQRILILGCSASGKSTIAKAIHKRTGLPIIHLDQHFHGPNWEEMERSAWRERVRELVAQPQWVMDGNYRGTLDIRLPAADTVIFLDRSRWLCLYRAIWRTIRFYGRQRPDTAAGCYDRFNWAFLQYIYHYNRTRRPKLLQLLQSQPPEKAVFHLTSNRAARSFLDSLPA